VETGGKVTEARCWRGFLALHVSSSRNPDWLAGDAVLIALVSAPIPCKQGILQGISQKLGMTRGLLAKKVKAVRRFCQISLLE
jgi:hypothetical protein